MKYRLVYHNNYFLLYLDSQINCDIFSFTHSVHIRLSDPGQNLEISREALVELKQIGFETSSKTYNIFYINGDGLFWIGNKLTHRNELVAWSNHCPEVFDSLNICENKIPGAVRKHFLQFLK